MPPSSTANPLADLVGLTDEELVAVSSGLTDRLANGDHDGARRLLADWALTVRIRAHPDFSSNAGAYREAIAAEG